MEDNNEDGLILKRHIIRHFDVEDVRTYGLSFAVKTKAAPGMFGSVIISKQQKKNNSRLKSMDRFEILHTRDFNPNSTDLVSFRKDVSKDQLGTYLVSLCKYFYEQASGNRSSLLKTLTQTQISETVSFNQVYQCCHCLTVYDESTGEPENNIVAGTIFQDLNKDYACPLCEGAKEDFKKITKDSLDFVVSPF
ncbi:MAG: rubredoxin [Chitinophagaceae bacterium]